MRQHLYRYLMVTLGCVLMGIAINAFYMPNKLISGGIGGVSVILYYLIGLPMGITSLLLNIPLFVAAYKFMDRSYIVSALYGMLVFSVSLDAFHFLAEKAPYVHDPMLACIAGGVIYGIGAAMMYRVGGSSGGTDIIGAIINKHYSISIGTTGFMFNIILMFIGACAGSTGGGIKVSRFILLIKTMKKELHTYLHPRSVRKIQLDGKVVEHNVLRSTNVYMIAYILIFVASVLLISLDNFDLTTNFTAVSATLNNIGPGLELVGPTQNFSLFSNGSKLILIFDMLAGRLELFPLLLLFVRDSWRRF